MCADHSAGGGILIYPVWKASLTLANYWPGLCDDNVCLNTGLLDSRGVTAQLQSSGSTSILQQQRLTKRPSVDSGIHLGSVQSSDSLPSLRPRSNKFSGGRETPKLSRFVLK
jgi:hypothetical protein